MFSIDNETFVIIPVAYNLFLNALKENDTPRYVAQNHISGSFIGTLVEYCKSKDVQKYIVIDMKNVLSYTSRAFTEFLSIKNTHNFIFINVHADSLLRESIFEDMSFSSQNMIPESPDIIFSTSIGDISRVVAFKSEIDKVVHAYTANIIASTTERGERYYPLESSTIYCNTYVNLKKLFFQISDATYIIYRMTELVVDAGYQNADAIISASKTGAVFANIIGQLLSKKTVHCMGIGPRFSVSNSLLKQEIRARKQYLFIGDFVCLGTEIKILNALIINYEATLIGGVCVSSYLPLEELKSESILSKVKNLENISACGVKYRISVTPDRFRKVNHLIKISACGAKYKICSEPDSVI